MAARRRCHRRVDRVATSHPTPKCIVRVSDNIVRYADAMFKLPGAVQEETAAVEGAAREDDATFISRAPSVQVKNRLHFSAPIDVHLPQYLLDGRSGGPSGRRRRAPPLPPLPVATWQLESHRARRLPVVAWQPEPHRSRRLPVATWQPEPRRSCLHRGGPSARRLRRSDRAN